MRKPLSTRTLKLKHGRLLDRVYQLVFQRDFFRSESETLRLVAVARRDLDAVTSELWRRGRAPE
jgi:hypothetical protein